MQLVIDRKTWLRGETPSFLLRETDRKMCCVGVYCRTVLGWGDDRTRSRGWPAQDLLPPEAKWLNPSHSNASWNDSPDICYANDATDLTDAEREPKIAEIFARHGVEVEFVN